MADSRIYNITNTVASGDLAALLNTLYLVVDASGFAEAKKVLFKTLLTEAVIDANTNNYQAMTPKSFYDSVMTTARMGIGQLATDGEVTEKSGTGLLNSVHQVLMQAQWKQDFFKTNGFTPGSMIMDTGDLSTAKAIAYQTVWSGALNSGSTCYLNPSFPTSKAFRHVYINLCVHAGGFFNKGTYSLIAPALGVQVDQALTGIPQCNLFIFNGGKAFGIYARDTTYADVRVSATINGTLWEV